MSDSELSNSIHHPNRVAALGEIAQATLAAYPTGKVLAVFRRSFYVQFDNSTLCFGSFELGNGPVNVLTMIQADVEWAKLGVTPQQLVRSSESVISVGDVLFFDCADAAIWRVPRIPTYSYEDLRVGLARLCRSASRRSPRGLGPLLIGLNAPSAWPVPSNDPLLQACQGPVCEIMDWLVRAPAHPDLPPPHSLRSMIGLGLGLTPSGDDFICGLMTALHYFRFANLAYKISMIVLPIALRETNMINAQYLRCAAQGQASNALFDALHSILTLRDFDGRLDVIDAIGHSSGWDSLAGAALVCAAVLRARHPESQPDLCLTTDIASSAA